MPFCRERATDERALITAAVTGKTALGQFISYRILLAEQYPEYILYLAVPLDTYTSFFATQLAQAIINSQKLKLIIYTPQQEVIDQWLN